MPSLFKSVTPPQRPVLDPLANSFEHFSQDQPDAAVNTTPSGTTLYGRGATFSGSHSFAHSSQTSHSNPQPVVNHNFAPNIAQNIGKTLSESDPFAIFRQAGTQTINTAVNVGKSTVTETFSAGSELVSTIFSKPAAHDPEAEKKHQEDLEQQKAIIARNEQIIAKQLQDSQQKMLDYAMKVLGGTLPTEDDVKNQHHTLGYTGQHLLDHYGINATKESRAWMERKVKQSQSHGSAHANHKQEQGAQTHARVDHKEGDSVVGSNANGGQG